MSTQLPIAATIDGKVVPRSEVQKWETRRAKAVLKKFASRLGPRAIAEIAPDLDFAATLTADLNAQRAALLTLKCGLGHAGVYAMLRRDIVASERIARSAVAASRGRIVRSITQLAAPGVSAEAFTEWFNNLVIVDDEVNMIDAMPDHYLLRGLPDGRQEVVETTGGSPFATRFVVDYTKSESLSTPAAPDYPMQIAGQALLDDGLVLGGVRHQFRDIGGTMEALLTIEFPGLTPPSMVAAHRWHLAVEFSNWITAFDRTAAREQS